MISQRVSPIDILSSDVINEMSFAQNDDSHQGDTIRPMIRTDEGEME